MLLGIGIFFVGFTGMAVASAIAIFRYRLWDIDILINRALVYTLLTVGLALVYYSSVVLLQGLFRTLMLPLQSEVVTVISTLAIAALFTPLRRRIQEGIDRRFYRRKYDAAQILAAFSATLRDEVDLDQLAERIVAVVEETMQPEHVSLWLRKPERKVRS
jgi:K+-sensing histidine kinase KdpD